MSEMLKQRIDHLQDTLNEMKDDHTEYRKTTNLILEKIAETNSNLAIKLAEKSVADEALVRRIEVMSTKHSTLEILVSELRIEVAKNSEFRNEFADRRGRLFTIIGTVLVLGAISAFVLLKG